MTTIEKILDKFSERFGVGDVMDDEAFFSLKRFISQSLDRYGEEKYQEGRDDGKNDAIEEGWYKPTDLDSYKQEHPEHRPEDGWNCQQVKH